MHKARRTRAKVMPANEQDERHFRTHETNASHSCSNYKRFTNILLLRRLRKKTLLVFCGSRASSRNHFEPDAAMGRARAVISHHLRLQARLEQLLRSPQRKRTGLGQPIPNAPAKPSGPSRPPWHGRAVSSCQFKAPAKTSVHEVDFPLIIFFELSRFE